MNYLKQRINITYADWPVILQFIGIYILILLAGNIILEDKPLFIFELVSTVFIVMLTLLHLYHSQNKKRDYLQYRIQAINEITTLLDLRSPLPPMTGWAATPELAVTVLKTIQTYRPKNIIELGSGVTSIVSAYTVEKYSPVSNILSFDHDSAFAGKTKKEIEQHNLNRFIKVVHAPLTDIKIDGETWSWYQLDKDMINHGVDLLIIDGPPVKTQKNARFPALPLLYPYISKNGIIILHDSDRNTEAATLKKWTQELQDITILKQMFSEKGITILQKQG